MRAAPTPKVEIDVTQLQEKIQSLKPVLIPKKFVCMSTSCEFSISKSLPPVAISTPLLKCLTWCLWAYLPYLTFKTIQSPLSPSVVLMYNFCWDVARKIRSAVTYKGNEMLDARDKRSLSAMLGLFFSASLLLLLEDSNNNSYFIG